jgi:hypothetical protein
MKVLGENSNNDLYVGDNNQLVVLTDIDATLQVCKSVVEVQRGNLKYAANRGIPLNTVVFSGKANELQFRYYAIEQIQGVTGVVSVNSFDTRIEDNTLFYEAEIQTVYGAGNINGGL